MQRVNTIATRRLGNGRQAFGEPVEIRQSAHHEPPRKQGFLEFLLPASFPILQIPRLDRMVASVQGKWGRAGGGQAFRSPVDSESRVMTLEAGIERMQAFEMVQDAGSFESQLS